MNDPDYDPDKALEEYGYGRRPSHGKTAAIAILGLLLIGAAGGAAYLGKGWSEEKAELLSAQQQLGTVTARISQLETSNAELSSLLADKQAETERLREEWTSQIETIREQHKEQLQRTYAQMNEIVYDSRKTIAYIGEIETLLRDGQALDEEQAGRLRNVVNGLAFLREQYTKPLGEFRELNRYFNQQLAALPENAVEPRANAKLGQRIFQGRRIREEQAQYFENQGRRSALSDAKRRVETAYASAQRQMAAVSLDLDQYLTELDRIIESNERSAEQVAEFFATSREILKIHDQIMSIEPPQAPAVQP